MCYFQTTQEINTLHYTHCFVRNHSKKNLTSIPKKNNKEKIYTKINKLTVAKNE